MYTIGKFSKITDIPVTTLRYYDECNILKPEIVDQYSNYRYYTDNNVYEAVKIKEMKNLGYSLDEICLYQGELTKDALENKIDELEQLKTEIENRIDNLNSKLIEKNNQMVLTISHSFKKSA